MITKMIATFPCGNKIIREKVDWNVRYCHGLKVDGQRPHLIQVFVKGADRADFEEIFKGLKFALHPVKGKLTVNGKYTQQWYREVKSG